MLTDFFHLECEIKQDFEETKIQLEFLLGGIRGMCKLMTAS